MNYLITPVIACREGLRVFAHCTSQHLGQPLLEETRYHVDALFHEDTLQISLQRFSLRVIQPMMQALRDMLPTGQELCFAKTSMPEGDMVLGAHTDSYAGAILRCTFLLDPTPGWRSLRPRQKYIRMRFEIRVAPAKDAE